MAEKRIGAKTRETAETRISVEWNLDGTAQSKIETGVPFFDHMLTLFAVHGLFDLEVKADGDVEVDYHHLVEDLGIVMGDCFREAVGDKAGIKRYGSFFLPMDETLVRVAVDVSNRPWLEYDLPASPGFVKDFNVGLFREFFQGFVNQARINLHIRRECGVEPHHLAEAAFKGTARSLDEATQIDPRRGGAIPSSKETLND
ncbi:MAG: imidazoleglycerol-phosphate dehydratase HisB [Verrucomicrobiota bacterium]